MKKDNGKYILIGMHIRSIYVSTAVRSEWTYITSWLDESDKWTKGEVPGIWKSTIWNDSPECDNSWMRYVNDTINVLGFDYMADSVFNGDVPPLKGIIGDAVKVLVFRE